MECPVFIFISEEGLQDIKCIELSLDFDKNIETLFYTSFEEHDISVNNGNINIQSQNA